MSKATLKIERPGLLRAFIDSKGASGGWTGAEDEWLKVHRIFDRRMCSVDLDSHMVIEFLCKWTGLGHGESTWELMSDLTDIDLVRFWKP